MSDIVYKLKENIYINLTNKCTNNCEFCDVELLSKDLKADLNLEKEPTKEEVIDTLFNKMKNSNPSEIVFCGVGEPLIRLDDVLYIIREIKKNYDKIVRVNTNGSIGIGYKNRELAKELKEAGVDKVSVSLNATNETDYIKICRPKFKKTFETVVRFVKDCKNVGLDTTISFVDYKIKKEEIKKFAEKLGVAYIIRPLLK